MISKDSETKAKPKSRRDIRNLTISAPIEAANTK
jgi:hypothetical protein